ncbi:hypothetical protein D9M72_630760 [compost metagenome]
MPLGRYARNGHRSRGRRSANNQIDLILAEETARVHVGQIRVCGVVENDDPDFFAGDGVGPERNAIFGWNPQSCAGAGQGQRGADDDLGLHLACTQADRE